MPKILQRNTHRFAEYAYAQQTLKPIDFHKERKKSGSIVTVAEGMAVRTPEMVQQGLDSPLDFEQWLPFAAPHYHISAKVEDYVMTPVIVMPSDLPNRNAVAFPKRELSKFNPALGQLAYETWKRKPTHYEHANEDITKAYGVIVDSVMRKMHNHQGNVFKILLLLSFDRSKHPDIANRILSGDLNSYSMGAFIGGYSCSYCNAELGECKHLDPSNPTQMYELNGKMVFRNVRDIEGFETSAVESPAFVSALSDTLIHIKDEETATASAEDPSPFSVIAKKFA